jgi:paraquat-inducible protein B
LADVRGHLKDLDSKTLVAEWTKAGTSLAALTSDPEIKNTLANVNGAVADLRALIANIDSQVDPAAEGFTATLGEVRNSLASFERVLDSLGAFVNAQQGLGDGANQAFHQLAAAAESVQRLADYLERNPGALLTGRRPPETPSSR